MSSSDIVIAHIPSTSHAIDDFVRDLDGSGVSIEHREEELGPFAGMEWLLPTAITVFIAEKYFGTIIQELAKEHYRIIKRALGHLVARTTGGDREIRVARVSSSPKKLQFTEPEVLSVYCRLRTGGRVKFLFEHRIGPEQRDALVDELHRLMAEHYARFPDDELTRSLARPGMDATRTVVMRFDTSDRLWHPWVPTIGPPSAV